MMPKKESNIYPKSDENLKAIISFYFDDKDVNQSGIFEGIKAETSLSLNQIEFIFRKLAEAYTPIFRKHLKGQIALKNLFAYGVDTLSKGSAAIIGRSRQVIGEEFLKFVKKTEVDFSYLEKNN